MDKLGLKKNNLDNKTIVHELSDAFDMKAEVERSPLQYIESSGTLVLKNTEQRNLLKQQNEQSKRENDLDSQIEFLLANR